MTAIRHQRKDLMIEARFLPDSIEQATRLRNRIYEVVAAGEVEGIAPGQAEAYADQVIGWLVGKTDGVDRKGPNTRSKYRRILQVLEDQAPTRGIRGVVVLDVAGVLAMSGSAAALVAPSSVGAAVLALVLPPIIYAPVEELEPAA